MIGYLYFSAARSLWTSLHERDAVEGQVAALRREYGELSRQKALLESRSYIETAARRLGFAFPGERQYLLAGGEG